MMKRSPTQETARHRGVLERFGAIVRIQSRILFGLAFSGMVLSLCRPARAVELYEEPLRPRFHFTAAKGWLNDPNGLVFYGGEYHLFFQHNPAGANWVEALSWGHAVSADLIHWKQLDEAIPPTPVAEGKVAGSWSGTGVVDRDNTAGFATGPGQRPIVLAWTATGLGQCLAFSNDAGRTFTKYAHNPVVPMDPPKPGDWDRDPDIFWYAPGKHWVMIYSVTGKGLVINTSADLKHWTRQGLIPDMFECPACFELGVEGEADNRKWVVWDGGGKYLIGRFDGKRFASEGGPFLLDGGKNYYAAQTWSNAPDGRRVGIAWMRDGKFPGMPFNQQMGIPFELKLRTIPSVGLRLTKLPVREVERLRHGQKELANRVLSPGDNALAGITGDAFDIEAELEPDTAMEISLTAQGQRLVWSQGRLSIGDASITAPLNREVLKLRVVIDRTSLEAYANDGAASMTVAFVPPAREAVVLSLECKGGHAKIITLRLWQMHSIWQADDSVNPPR